MKRTMLASVLVLVLCGIVSAYEYRVSWIHGENPPDLSIVPDCPTTEDIIHFSMPTDIFANQWVAEHDLGGTPTLSRDGRTIKLRIQGPPPEGPIPTLWDPVCGLEGSFGPLEEGTWLFDCYLPGTIWLVEIIVIPPPPHENGPVNFKATVTAHEDHDVFPVCYGDYFVPVAIDQVLEDSGNLLACRTSVEVCYYSPLGLRFGDKVEVYGYYYGGVCPLQYCGRIRASGDSYYIREIEPELYDDGESYRSFSPQTVESGQPFYISCDIRNGGGTDSGPFTVRFYASVDTDVTADDPRIGKVSILNIDAGDYANCEWSGVFPTDIPPGQYYVGWIIDADGEVDESDETNNTAYKEGYKLTMDSDYIYIDDDAAGDPGPNNPAISDPNENGSAEHPFDMIQEGIDAALDGETVIVRDGTYWEAIEFAGRNITVTGFEPNEPNAIPPYPVIDANYIGTAVTFCNEEEPNCILEGFVITRGAGEVAGGINCVGSSPTISRCLILGNRVMDPNGGGGAVFFIDSNAVFENCTFSGNYGGERGAGLYLCDSNAVLLNCILWDNLPYQIVVACGLDPNITFSDVQDAWPGQGNIDIAPSFAELGYWADANNPNIAVEPSEANAVWVGGDYHLKSQAGRWDPYSASWLIDDVTSLCIDAGDSNSDWIAELWPHGKRINMGAYGGTPQASMSLSTVAAPLSKALDTALSFTTGGSADWFSQTTTSYYDGDAAQSGDISHGQESWMQATVSGSGTLRFYWKVSSESRFDYLEFYIDGVRQDRISGSVDWEQKTYTISTLGSHTLEWRYMKDWGTDEGSDCGWVDKVEWVTTP